MYDNENGGYADGKPEDQGVADNETDRSGENKSSYSYYDMNSGAGGSGTSGQNDFSGNVRNKGKKPRGKTPRILTAVATAAVVGVVAGACFFGVNYAANIFAGNISEEQTAEADTDSSSFEDSISEVMENGETGQQESAEDSASSDSAELTVKEVAEKCMPSTVTIAAVSQQELSSIFGGTQVYESTSAGTGVIIGTNDTELLIATNQHVTSGATSLSVGFIDETAVDAQIKGEDSENDLAVVAVKLENIPAETMEQISVATIGNSDELALGEQVVAIGNALGYGQSVTSGYISAKDRDLTLTDGTYTYNATDMLQTDTAINMGNSGGPLFNMKGEVVGINEAKRFYSTSGDYVEGMGYAIPISKAEPILRELMSLSTREKVDEDERGYLGVTLANVTADVSQMYSMPVGACITEVLEGSPAQEAGLQKGDVITGIDGREVTTYDDLTNQLEYYAEGDTVDFVIMRADNGEYIEKTIPVTLGGAGVLDDYYSSNG